MLFIVKKKIYNDLAWQIYCDTRGALCFHRPETATPTVMKYLAYNVVYMKYRVNKILCPWNVMFVKFCGYKMYCLCVLNSLSIKFRVYEMSYLWNVVYMKCCVYWMLCLLNVVSMKCCFYWISRVWNEIMCLWNVVSMEYCVHEMSCHKISCPWHILSVRCWLWVSMHYLSLTHCGKCCSYEISCLWNVVSLKYCVYELSSYKMSLPPPLHTLPVI